MRVMTGPENRPITCSGAHKIGDRYIQIRTKNGRKLEVSRKYTCSAAKKAARPMPKTTMVPRKYNESSIFSDQTWVRKMAWKMKYTGTVGRKRKNAVRTADNGISNRGNGVFNSSLPELVTEVAPLVTE